MKAISKCKTDFKILIEEPNETDKDSGSWEWDADIETDYIEVNGVEIILKLGKDLYRETTTGGVAEFKGLPCGAYTIEAKQEGFEIDLGTTKIVVVKSTKPELSLKIRRKLYLLEMYRIDRSPLSDIIGGSSDASYGHWFTFFYPSEIAANPTNNRGVATESYGWWPMKGAIGDSNNALVEAYEKEETRIKLEYRTGKIDKKEATRQLEEAQRRYEEESSKMESPMDTIVGVKGVLNGYNPDPKGKSYGGASPTTDPYQIDPDVKRGWKKLSDVFFPYVVGGKTAKEYQDCYRNQAQSFSSSVSDRWHWRTDDGGWHCQTFQKYIMKQCGLRKSITFGGLGTWTDEI